MQIAVLVKQIPKFDEMQLGPDGRLRRDGIELELNPYCRRAVSQAVELASARAGSRVTVITLGPPTAEDSLREAIAWGLDARGRHRRRARHRPRVRGFGHARDRARARGRARARRPPQRRSVRPRAHGPQLRRRRHRPGRARARANCATCRSSPASGTSRSRERSSPPGASTTTAGSRPRSVFLRSCRARNGSSTRPRSIRRAARPCPPNGSAASPRPTSARVRGARPRRRRRSETSA